MDNVVLTRVAAALGDDLRGAVLEAMRDEPSATFRLVFVLDERPRTVVLSLDPGNPWIGRPALPAERRGRRAASPFSATCTKSLRGRVLAGLSKPSTCDRRVEFQFAGGPVLIAELSPPSPELVLLDESRSVIARAGRGRASRERLAAGRSYRPRPVPPGKLDPFDSAASAIDRKVGEIEASAGVRRSEAIRRALLGVGRVTADQVAAESAVTGDSVGSVVVRRMEQVRAADVDPIIEGKLSPAEVAERGMADGESQRLLPWEPLWAVEPPRSRFREDNPAATAGLHHEALARARVLSGRGEALRSLLASEIRRLREVEARIAGDRTRFADPDVWKRRGEALLAGLATARRDRGSIFVADPYDPEGPPLEVPVDGGLSFPEAAESCFVRYRRARRGGERAAERGERVARRRAGLERLAAVLPSFPTWAVIAGLEEQMREAGIAIGLWASPAAARATRAARPRIEGARILRSSDGWTILVGKNGKDNARLTFKLASPEDFWLHALGVHGAHVVVRNDEKRTTPPPRTLAEAAAVAAWFSEAKSQPQVDVQWTRRKYVRNIRGAAPGTVRLKRFETVRVRPRIPKSLEPTS